MARKLKIKDLATRQAELDLAAPRPTVTAENRLSQSCPSIAAIPISRSFPKAYPKSSSWV